ncbi:MAG TPA: helix-turn-helix domain-containing protein [Longimicrobiales bacterium]
MSGTDWRKRMRESTRGRVVALLRRTARTVSELAGELGLTANAVRLHLSGLERDGLVEPCGTRREWTGKPAVVYRATAAAETLYPKPYDVVLAELLTVLEEQREAGEVEALLREAGRRLGAATEGGSPDLRSRVERAAAALTELGGLAEVEEDADGYRIQGYSCPLAALTSSHPLTCALAESLVSELVGAPAAECCERGERPRCAFRIAAA